MCRWLPGLVLVAACGAADGPVVVRLADVVDADGEGRIDLTVALDGERALIVEPGDDRIVEAWLDGGDFVEGDAGWLAPRPVAADAPLEVTMTGDGDLALIVWARGAPLPAIRRERSLTWTDPVLLDDPATIGLGRVMAAIASDGHGGAMLDAWFRRFASTAHSERAAPAQWMDEVAVQQGADPTAWDLDALPFRVTAVHDRIDLAARAGDCGELRVSLASTHPVYAPLHLIFLFTQPVADDDVTPDGRIHCAGTARRWARLSALDGDAWLAAARAWLDAHLRAELFRIAESVELTVSPWEWRQWAPVDVDVLDNPPLFETVDTAGLAAPSSRRDAFLSWVEAEADGIAARTIEIPEAFRAPSAQAPPSTPRPAIDLTGVDPAVLDAHPALGRSLEIVGCPLCHTEDADFVQTSDDRTFSPFYDRELDERGERLGLMNAGVVVPVPPFGPLQP